MAITQERVMNIIAAGQDYQQALRKAISLLSSADASIPEIATLQFQIAESDLLQKPMKSAVTLAVEEQHFRRNHIANERRKYKQTLKRRDKGVKEKITAPASLMRLDEIAALSHEERVEKKIASGVDPLLATLRAEHPNMSQDQFNKVYKEAKKAADEEEARARAEAAKTGAADAPAYSAFDPPDSDDSDGPIVDTGEDST